MHRLQRETEYDLMKFIYESLAKLIALFFSNLPNKLII